MFKLLGCCMSKEDIFENLVYNPFGKNNHAVLSEVMKTYPISSLFVSNKQLSFIHSYVYHVKEQTLSNDILLRSGWYESIFKSNRMGNSHAINYTNKIYNY